MCVVGEKWRRIDFRVCRNREMSTRVMGREGKRLCVCVERGASVSTGK